MNIYLHTEISARELDSKLLLGVLAASRGHTVIVADHRSLMRMISTGAARPGICHTKDLTPSPSKIKYARQLVDRGFSITSIDEEGGLIDYGYDDFARLRYSEESINEASAVFAWGESDSSALKAIYSNQSQKIFKTGSPRADLWRTDFSPYWRKPKDFLSRPYFLISSNMGLANNWKRLWERVEIDRAESFYDKDPERLIHQFGATAEDFRKTAEFIKAIRSLAHNNSDFDIVLRPHPVEEPHAWETYLRDIPGVYVIGEGAISEWIEGAFAVMHNGCTSALEATIAGKPVVTYLPFPQDYQRPVPDELGYQAHSAEELLDLVSDIFDKEQRQKNEEKREFSKLPEILKEKVYIDPNELSAKKMIAVWERLMRDQNFDSASLLGCIFSCRQSDIIQRMRSFAWRHFFNKKNLDANSYKFPPLDIKEMKSKVKALQGVLRLNKGIKVRSLGARALMIRVK